jgi:hypothetical protein
MKFDTEKGLDRFLSVLIIICPAATLSRVSLETANFRAAEIKSMGSL